MNFFSSFYLVSQIFLFDMFSTRKRLGTYPMFFQSLLKNIFVFWFLFGLNYANWSQIMHMYVKWTLRMEVVKQHICPELQEIWCLLIFRGSLMTKLHWITFVGFCLILGQTCVCFIFLKQYLTARVEFGVSKKKVTRET